MLFPFTQRDFSKLRIKTEIGVSRLGESLEEDREEPVVVVGVLISTLSEDLFPQVRHLCGQFANIVATLLEGHFFQAFIQILYVDNHLVLHHANRKLEKYKPTKDTHTFHFVSVIEVILLC